ncbi:MAG: hypothetical protein AAB316_22885, partial [Bacteroidota bacterium]
MATFFRNSNYQRAASDTAGAPQEGFSIGRLLLFLVVAGFLGFLAYKQFKGDDEYSNIPKEVQIKYVPSDFTTDVDLENALPILSNPYRYAREFDQLIHDFNLSLLRHVANR